MSKKKNYRVWFEQVNRVNYEITASSKEEAKVKAERIWRRENGKASAKYIEDGKL